MEEKDVQVESVWREGLLLVEVCLGLLLVFGFVMGLVQQYASCDSWWFQGATLRSIPVRCLSSDIFSDVVVGVSESVR